jgi:PTS system nitrogen regulatory IIA component
MIRAVAEHAKHSQPVPPATTDLATILSPERVTTSMPVTSKKKLLENMTGLLLRGNASLNENTVLQILTERERLGSTGIGKGVALPHGRVPGLERPVGAFATLEQSIDFDAIDKYPVTMAFALLVPEEATQQHLRVLAHLAGMFNDDALREAITRADSSDQIYQHLVNWHGQRTHGS